MQRSGTEAIRYQIQSSKPSQNTKGICVQPSGQLFSKRWPLSNRSRTENNINTRKVNGHRNSVTKTGNSEPQQNYRHGTASNELLGA